MKKLIYFAILSIPIVACNNSAINTKENTTKVKKNEVLVLGTIHSGHLKQEEFNLEVLTDLVVKINPDLILTEIPPDRFEAAVEGFMRDDTISEPRVMRFPEYVDVIFPLSKKMDFKMIPTAGWTKEMADKRSAQLKAISKDENRVEDWKKYKDAGALSDSLMDATGTRYDPYWINSDKYDELVEIQLGVYNELFNEELGPGGWDNINEAHFGHIADALDKYSNQGKRILITYGAGHKGWFLRALKKRDDVNIISLKEAVTTKI